MPHTPTHPHPRPGGGGRNPIQAGGFLFGRPRFGSSSMADLERIAGLFSGANFDPRGRRIRAGDLRRFLAAQGDALGRDDRMFLSNFLNPTANPPAPDVQDDEGNFRFGRNFDDLLSEDQLARLADLLSRRGTAVGNNVRGRRVNVADLVRLAQVIRGKPGGQHGDRQFLGEVIDILKGRNQGGEGLPEGGGGGGGGGGLPEASGPGGGGGGLGGGGDIIPNDIRSSLEDRLRRILDNPGFDDDILRDARNQIFRSSKHGLRDNLLRAEERFAARGLGDSGLSERAFEDIEDRNLSGRQTALTNLDTANAAFANQSLGTALSGIFGLGGLNLDTERVRGGLELGARGLDLQEFGLLLDSIIQELLINLQLGALSGFGSGGGGGINDILANLFGPGGRPFETPAF